MQEFKGKVAVITGGASGIGLALARRFAAEGMKLVLADIEDAALNAAVSSLRADGAEALGVRTDVSDAASVEALAQAASRAFGPLHLIVNNAGVSITGPIWKQSLDDWRWVYGVNVWGVIHGVRTFVPLLLEHGQPAHVVNVASLAAFHGNGDHAPYCSSKAAVHSISQALYSELVAWNTRVGVSCVCPGMVATRIHQSWRNRPQEDRPWSDREFADPQHRRGSEAFQGRGVPPEAVAEATLQAIRDERFYVFTGELWSQFMHDRLDPVIRGDDPPVVTWGPDLRRKPGQDA